MTRTRWLFCCLAAAGLVLGGHAGTEPASPKALHWETMSQSFEAVRGQTNVSFVFRFANLASSNIVVEAVRPSCSCTTARWPGELPARLAPGDSGQMDVDVDLRDRWDRFKQIIAVETSAGTNRLALDIKPPEPTPRERDQLAAFADRQAMFKGKCADCHLHPARGKSLEGRYRVLCGTCHDSPQRASMIPDLASVKGPFTRAYWDEWVRRGKPGTYMPAFAKRFGGPLADEELAALVDYLAARFAKKAEAARGTGPSSATQQR